MAELAKRKDIIITSADKGGPVVIMDVEKYINKANNQLSDKRNYKALQEDPTLQHIDLVKGTIGRFKKENLLFRKLADGLNLKPPKFCISPKLHKENNPGRPVINSINCHNSEISRCVDHHLKHLVREIPLYIKDTNNFINKINNFPVPPNSLLVTMDVKSLYTSIPNNEGIASVKKKYDHLPKKDHKTFTDCKTFLPLILTLNNFIFN